MPNDVLFTSLKTMLKEQIKHGDYPLEPNGEHGLKACIKAIQGRCKNIPEVELNKLFGALIKECADEALAEPTTPSNANFLGAMVKVAMSRINAELAPAVVTEQASSGPPQQVNQVAAAKGFGDHAPSL